jgi:hypothetical protein
VNHDPRRQGAWKDITIPAPTLTVLQSTVVPSPLTAGAGTGAEPNFVGVAYGTGAPTFSAPNGTLYSRKDGVHGSTTLLYVNTSGANTIGTTWTALE